MEIRKLVRWSVSGLAAVFVLGPGGNAVYDFYKSGGLSGLPTSLVSGLALLGSFASQPWFPWAAGLAFGATIGLWADSYLKRFAAHPIPRVKCWFDLDDAAQMFATPDQAHRYMALLDEHRRVAAEYDAYHKAEQQRQKLAKTTRLIDDILNPPNDEPQPLNVLFEVAGNLTRINNEQRNVRDEMRDALLLNLSEGRLTSKGYLGKDLSGEVPIPPSQWRVLIIQHGNLAEAGAVKYSAVQVGEAETTWVASYRWLTRRAAALFSQARAQIRALSRQRPPA
jgi:hypothetical protein